MKTNFLTLLAILSLAQFSFSSENALSQNVKTYSIYGESSCSTDSGKVFPDPNIKMLDGSLKLVPNSQDDKALLYSMNLKFEVSDKKMTCNLDLTGLLVPGNVPDVFRSFVLNKSNVQIDECNEAIGMNTSNLVLVVNQLTNNHIMAMGYDGKGAVRDCGSIDFLLDESLR